MDPGERFLLEPVARVVVLEVLLSIENVNEVSNNTQRYLKYHTVVFDK